MLKIIDSLSAIEKVYEDGSFSMERWKQYMEELLPGHSDLFIRDMQDMCGMGDFSFEEDVLPVLNTVSADPLKFSRAESSFRSVTDGLEEKIRKLFGRAPEATVLLYLGLCNGAGWVTEIDGEPYVLLGIEKILELDWCDTDAMNGLIYHELGHMYHRQFGQFANPPEGPDHFLWQLFAEGIAQFFESTLVGDKDYFHQDAFGWLMWCDIYRQTIKEDFNEDLPFMTQENQCYFGDWVDYGGKSDVGYYLGARFVQWIGEKNSFDEMIAFSADRIRQEWRSYLEDPTK